MKIVALSLMAIGATGSAWAWLGPDLAGPRESPEVAEAKAKAGARQMLSDHPDLEVRNLVIGTTHPGVVLDFRGRLMRDGRLKPAYGQVRPICARDREQPTCWEIAHMEIDGQVIGDLAAFLTLTNEPSPVEPARAQSGRPQGAALPGGLAMTATATAPKPAKTSPHSDEGATHRVARPIINARSGPGTEHSVIAKLKEGVHLRLVDGQAGWGRFVVLDSDNAGKRVWAALRILDEVE